MSRKSDSQNVQRASRRSFTAAMAATLAGGASLKGQTPVALTQKTRDALTPAQIIEIAKAGNQRYVTGTLKQRDFLAEQKATAKGQYPAAIVLGCIDSRVPAEIIFNLGIGDIFKARVAGNIENDDLLGSMEFATKLSGAKLVVVMGHSACGAVKGAISGAKLGNLTGLLAKIRPAVEATVYQGKRTADDRGFVDAVGKKNVELTIANIRRKSPVMAELENAGAIQIVGAFHNLETGAVEFL
jgi:carbonic anhydrase